VNPDIGELGLRNRSVAKRDIKDIKADLADQRLQKRLSRAQSAHPELS
jgi:hypothetical protein